MSLGSSLRLFTLSLGNRNRVRTFGDTSPIVLTRLLNSEKVYRLCDLLNELLFVLNVDAMW